MYESSLPWSCSADATPAFEPGAPVQRGRLVRVLAVARALHEIAGDRDLLGQRVRVAGEPLGDRCVVRGQVRERLARQAPARLEREPAFRDLLDDRVVVARRRRGRRPSRGSSPRRAPSTDRRRRSAERLRRPASTATHLLVERDRGCTRRDRSAAMPCSAIVDMCSGLLRSARIPPCSIGCSVLTRPSSISGNPVTSATSMTSKPASRSHCAGPAGRHDVAPGVDESASELVGPRPVVDGHQRAADLHAVAHLLSPGGSCRPTAVPPRPRRSSRFVPRPSACPLRRASPPSGTRRTRRDGSCCSKDSIVSSGATVDRALDDDRPHVELLGGEVHRHAGGLHAPLPCVLDRMRAGERRQAGSGGC